MKILVIHGVNLNALGKRDKIYGDVTLEQINALLKSNMFVNSGAVELDIFQSNIEGEIVDKIQSGGYDALIINPGAYAHYSYAIADALADISVPKVEVHLTNIFAREEFRKHSVTAEKCDGCIMGMGAESYNLALDYLYFKLCEE